MCCQVPTGTSRLPADLQSQSIYRSLGATKKFHCNTFESVLNIIVWHVLFQGPWSASKVKNTVSYLCVDWTGVLAQWDSGERRNVYRAVHDSSCLSGRTQLLGMRGWQVVLIGRTERQNHGSAYMLATWRLPVLTSFNVTSSIMIRINPNSTLQVRTDTKTLFSVFGTNTSGHSIGIRHTSARAPFCNLLLQNTIFFSVYILQ